MEEEDEGGACLVSMLPWASPSVIVSWMEEEEEERQSREEKEVVGDVVG